MNSGVSVVIPAHNAEKYLCNSVKSVIKTRYKPFEIIIIEDGSSDKTVEIAKDLEKKYYPVVRVAHHPGRRRRGAGTSRNVGARLSIYPYLAFLDADDLFLPNRFAVSPKLLDRRADIDLIVEPIETLIEEEGRARQGLVLPRIGFHCDNPDDLFERAFGKQYNGDTIAWGVNGMTIRRTVFQYIGGFSERQESAEDLTLRIKLLLTARIISGQDQTVAIYRIHANNTSRYAIKPNHVAFDSFIEAIDWMRGRNVDPLRCRLVREAAIEKGYYALSRYLRQGSRKASVAVLLKILKLDPNRILSRRFAGCVWRAMKV